MPDEVAAFKYQAQAYLVMANEGDTKVFILPFDLNAADGGLGEEERSRLLSSLELFLLDTFEHRVLIGRLEFP